ncbi:MAG: nucleotidyl transferase AbiEii/AbiGii toxin family protein [Acidobacteria bacterium]|nr:nucleotidyl transferase AbiEii/AbiGii toxin family protein [Acidobacteriota bacterium]
MKRYNQPMHPEVLPEGWASVAVELDELGLLNDAYLAGGTGLALRFGHRVSIDLDLMLPVPFSSEDVRDRLQGRPGLRHLELAPHTLHAEMRGITISFLHYRYPLLFPTDPLGGLQVADARDIACMMAAAISDRGGRRDFVDLYVAGQTFGLAQILDWFDRKYSGVSYSRTHLLKALTHFGDAEDEPLPALLIPLNWSDVRRYFETEAPTLLRL